VWDVYPKALHWPVANGEPFTSRGHQPEQLIDVHVNDAARPGYLSLVTDTVFPDGAVLVEVSRILTANSRGFAMRKAGGQWSYFELDPQGGLLQSGDLSLCAGCHAQAPADHVFGLPRPP
jgi:hypothetical protein